MLTPLRSPLNKVQPLQVVAVWVLAVLLSVALSSSVSAETSSATAGYRTCNDGYACPNYACTPRPGDQVYLISTRCLPGGCGVQLPVDSLAVSRFEVGTGWVDSDIEELLTTESPQGLTSMFIHGNRMDTGWAHRRGWAMYHELTRGIAAEKNIRYIIWSWPSETSGGIIKSTRANGYRTNDEAYYVSSFLNRLPKNEKVSLAGFSFGARVISGALHLLSGGSLYGRSLESINPKDHDYRVVFFAGAVSCHWLSPGQYHSLALNKVEHLLNFFNSADPMLKRYHVVHQDRNDQALGYVGLCCQLAEGHRSKVTQYNTCSSIGKEHSWNDFGCCYWIMNLSRQMLLWEEL